MCTSLKSLPENLIPQSTGEPPPAPGTVFAADILKWNRRLVLVLRERSTSYTLSCLVEDEHRGTLAPALIQLCLELRPLDGPHATIRVDPSPGFTALRNSDRLAAHRLALEIGEAKNPNKNPIAEKAIQELGTELLQQNPRGGAVTAVAFTIATPRLNSWIQSHDLSTREMWFQRDQYTNDQLPFHDRDLII